MGSIAMASKMLRCTPSPVVRTHSAGHRNLVTAVNLHGPPYQDFSRALKVSPLSLQSFFMSNLQMPILKNKIFKPVPAQWRSVRSQEGSLANLELESSGHVKRKTSFNGIFSLLLLNLVAYVADHWLQLRFMKSLYLYHDFPRWYQFITSTFCHVSWSHLSSNLFFLYIFGMSFHLQWLFFAGGAIGFYRYLLLHFCLLGSAVAGMTEFVAVLRVYVGKLVEEEEGSLAVWMSYLVTGVGANLVSWLILPRSVVSVGASGAVFGLFAISVLVKLSFDWRKILEVLILGQFVVEKVMEAAQSSTQLAGRTYVGAANINHIAHLSGALVGVLLIWLLNRIPLGDDPSPK